MAFGEEYLFKAYSPQIADWYLKNSNLLDVKRLIPEFVGSGVIEKRTATIADIDELLDDDWLALELNARTLNGWLAGFSAHIVVIFGHKGSTYRLPDPGLSPLQDRKVSPADLLKAWQYGGDEKAALLTLKPQLVD